MGIDSGHVHIDAFRNDLAKLQVHLICVLIHSQNSTHLILALFDGLPHFNRILVQRINQLMVEFLSVCYIGEATLAYLLIK